MQRVLAQEPENLFDQGLQARTRIASENPCHTKFALNLDCHKLEGHLHSLPFPVVGIKQLCLQAKHCVASALPLRCNCLCIDCALTMPTIGKVSVLSVLIESSWEPVAFMNKA